MKMITCLPRSCTVFRTDNQSKTPEDIYKSHLAETGGVSRRRDGGGQVDSARANLASTFVNAFVNAGYGQDQVRSRPPSSFRCFFFFYRRQMFAFLPLRAVDLFFYVK